MLFLFGGKYREPARLILGLALIGAGLLIHHGILLVAAGAVLAAWGVAGVWAAFRRRRRDRPDDAGQAGQQAQDGPDR